MKTYIVTSIPVVGKKFLLTFPYEENFITNDERIAWDVFTKEVQALSETFQKGADLKLSTAIVRCIKLLSVVYLPKNTKIQEKYRMYTY